MSSIAKRLTLNLLVVSASIGCVLSAPVAAHAHPSVAGAALSSLRPVVILIPGYGNPAALLPASPLGRSLTDNGYLVLPANVGDMTGDLTAAAHAVVTQSRDLQAAGYRDISLVGISTGGLVARTALTITHAQGDHPYREAVSLGGPLQGADLEALGPGWECGGRPACEQLKPSSQFMQNLPPLPVGKNTTTLTSIWTQDDLVVAPASSQLPAAFSIHLQTACSGIAGIWTGHEHLTSSPAPISLVLEVLTGNPNPTAAYGCHIPTSTT